MRTRARRELARRSPGSTRSTRRRRSTGGLREAVVEGQSEPELDERRSSAPPRASSRPDRAPTPASTSSRSNRSAPPRRSRSTTPSPIRRIPATRRRREQIRQPCSPPASRRSRRPSRRTSPTKWKARTCLRRGLPDRALLELSRPPNPCTEEVAGDDRLRRPPCPVARSPHRAAAASSALPRRRAAAGPGHRRRRPRARSRPALIPIGPGGQLPPGATPPPGAAPPAQQAPPPAP